MLGYAKGGLTLSKEGRSRYVIVTSVRADSIDHRAATEFQRLFALSTGVTLPIISDTQPARSHEILIGHTTRPVEADTTDLQEDGLSICTQANRLIITGGSDKGVLYGVYTFFDQYLGYRCFSPTVFKYPHLDRVHIASNLHDTQVPVNRYRNTFYAVAEDPFYADWHKLDRMQPEWGMWVHTFSRLMPEERYFSSHPDYFALVDGQRVARQADPGLHAQLCLTSQGGFETLCENLKAEMDKQPQARYWSVSQNDTYATGSCNCTCPSCAALDSAAGSPSGSIIAFVNRVAARFPDKIISTLAYRYSRKAPVGIRPAKNVNIMLCDIECNRHMPIEQDTSSAAFRTDFEAWGKISQSILMWDYVIQFSNLMAPYPNLRVLQPNMQYFVRNGVTAQFQQGNISRGGEFCELRPYLIARLLWNPNIDLRAELTDFLQGYYSEAAPYIAQYIDLMHDELEQSGLPLTIYGRPYDHFKGYMRPEAFARYEALFDQAEAAVASDPEVSERVKTARMPLTFALLDIAQGRGLAEDRVFEQTASGWIVRPQIMQRLEAMVALCNKVGVQRFVEGALSPDEYLQRTREALQKITQQH